MKFTKRIEDPRRFLQAAALHLASSPDDTITIDGIEHQHAVDLLNTLLLKNKELGTQMLIALDELPKPTESGGSSPGPVAA